MNVLLISRKQKAKKHFRFLLHDGSIAPHDSLERGYSDDFYAPFEDPGNFFTQTEPESLEAVNYEDSFTLYLKKLCKVCGKKFSSSLKHIKNDLTCNKYYDAAELEAMRSQPTVSMSRILQLNEQQQEEIERIEDFIYGMWHSFGSTFTVFRDIHLQYDSSNKTLNLNPR